MTADLTDMAGLKRRLVTMLAIDAVCFVIAAVAMVGYLRAHVAALGPVFIAAIVAGVAAQIWFIVGFARTGGDDKHTTLKA